MSESSSARTGSTRLRLRITAAAENYVRSGHPWVFAESVREKNRDGAAGELAVIYDRKDKFLAVGLFDPDSPIRVRVLHAGKPTTIDAAWWSSHMDASLQRREGLFDANPGAAPVFPLSCSKGGEGRGEEAKLSPDQIPSPLPSPRPSGERESEAVSEHARIFRVHTNGFRLINGESDGWPGLVLDRYAETLVLKIYTAAWLPRLKEITALIGEKLKPDRIVLRMSRNIQSLANAQFSLTDGSVVLGSAMTGCQTFLESGICFEADVLRGQKTGFFLDQRENRRLVESLARGRDVLNAFSFSGGFSLYAARGGAKTVTDLDISKHALESAKRNFALNQSNPTIASCRHESIQTDAFEWLAGNESHKFDLIVLDPPSLAKRESERAGAIRAYGNLVETGLHHLSPGGILVACSCSAHVSAEEFFGITRQTATRSGRRFTELQTTHHAPDHHATFAEAHYLKGIYLRF